MQGKTEQEHAWERRDGVVSVHVSSGGGKLLGAQQVPHGRLAISPPFASNLSYSNTERPQDLGRLHPPEPTWSPPEAAERHQHAAHQAEHPPIGPPTV